MYHIIYQGPKSEDERMSRGGVEIPYVWCSTAERQAGTVIRYVMSQVHALSTIVIIL
jgi:hypothetical protein